LFENYEKKFNIYLNDRFVQQ